MPAQTDQIGLIGAVSDAGLNKLAEELERKGAASRRIDLAKFPEDLALHIDAHGIGVQAGLGSASAYFVARGEYMSPVPDWVPTVDEWIARGPGIQAAIRLRQEARSVRSSIVQLLSEARPVANPWHVHRDCLFAPKLLRRLAAAGLDVAPFVSGNDLEKIALFVDQCAERCLCRRLTESMGCEAVADFSFLKARHLDFDAFPLIVRRAMGGAQFKALVVDGRFLGAVELRENRWQRALASPAIAVCAIAAAQEAGLFFGQIGLELDPESRPWVVSVQDELDVAAMDTAMDGELVPALAAMLVRLGRCGADNPHIQRPRDCALLALENKPPHSKGARESAGLTIGLAGQVSNAEVFALQSALVERGALAVSVELPLFPDRRALHEQAGGGRIAEVALSDLDAVFLRSSGVSSPLPGDGEPCPGGEEWEALHSRFARFSRDQAECTLFKYSVLEILGDRIPVFNNPLGQDVHRSKIWQLFSLARAGCLVPPTAAGNDRQALALFVESQGGEGEVVLKPLAGIYKTRLLAEVGLDAALCEGPVILQRFIRGDTIRAYLVGGRLIGAGKILHAGDAVDSSVDQRGVEPVDLPAAVVAEGWRAAQHLGLAWTGMDFVRENTTSRHFILECNAAAMFANFSKMTGADVPGALADLLIDLALRKKRH